MQHPGHENDGQKYTVHDTTMEDEAVFIFRDDVVAAERDLRPLCAKIILRL